MLIVAPMTSSPADLVTGIGSPVSMDSSTAEAPSTTTPSTGTLSPGRTRSRSPATTVASSTSSSTPSRTRRAVVAWSADQPPDRARGPPLRPALEPPPEQDQADDDRRAVEVGHGLDAGRLHQLGPQRHHHRIAPGGGGPDGDQRVHRHAAVAAGPPGRAVEAAARPELDQRRRPQDEPVEGLDAHRRLGHEHHEHDPDGGGDRRDGLDQRRPLRPLALDVVGRELGGDGHRRGAGGLVTVRPDLVAGGLDGPHELVAPGDARVDADGRALGGEVDGGVLDARRPASGSARCG